MSKEEKKELKDYLAKAAITKFSKEYVKFKKDNNLTDKDVAKALKVYAQEVFNY